MIWVEGQREIKRKGSEVGDKREVGERKRRAEEDPPCGNSLL
jgi:hypothetical protein